MYPYQLAAAQYKKLDSILRKSKFSADYSTFALVCGRKQPEIYETQLMHGKTGQRPDRGHMPPGQQIVPQQNRQHNVLHHIPGRAGICGSRGGHKEQTTKSSSNTSAGCKQGGRQEAGHRWLWGKGKTEASLFSGLRDIHAH